MAGELPEFNSMRAAEESKASLHAYVATLQ
jgi:hypothetical protein